MNHFVEDYNRLHVLSKHARTLTGISNILEWDQETYMPKAAAEIRGEQQKALAGIIHAKKTGRPFAKALARLIDETSGELKGALDDEKQAALRLWRRDYMKAKSLPKRFVEDHAKLSSQAILAWREAKDSDNFALFSPFLNKLVAMARKKADYLKFNDHPYDALLDEFEPEATTAKVETLFGHLKEEITSLLTKILKSKEIDDSCLHGTFSHDKQLSFAHRLLKDMGFSFEQGRLDLSSHPFSLSPHPKDNRITTRFHKTSILSCIAVVLHEGGHALYEAGLPEEHYGSPLGEPISLGMHESQSRLWETRIGQSLPFWQHYLPILNAHFDDSFKTVSPNDFYRAVNKVEPSFIRVEADEVTYPLHVILRFELEKSLIEGSLKVKDLPEAWNAKMQSLLGLTPSTNREGCLQDIHWSMGSFGYFPTYTLGNLYAAQLFEAFALEHSNWQNRVKEGELLFIKEWLNDNIHRHGRRYFSHELIEKISGKPFSANAYTSYLNDKYKRIYGFS